MEQLRSWFAAALPGLWEQLQAMDDELYKIGCQYVTELKLVNFDKDVNAILLKIERRNWRRKVKLSTTGKCFSIHI